MLNRSILDNVKNYLLENRGLTLDTHYLANLLVALMPGELFVLNAELITEDFTDHEWHTVNAISSGIYAVRNAE